VFTVAACEGSEVRPLEARRIVRSYLAVPLRVYGAWRLQRGSYLSAEFGLMFVSSGDLSQAGTMLAASADGTFDGLERTCESVGQFFAQLGAVDFLISPG
jgi:hypothetical protein